MKPITTKVKQPIIYTYKQPYTQVQPNNTYKQPIYNQFSPIHNLFMTY